MAETEQDQKTEEPTAKRLSDAREKGEVPMAPEVRHAVMFVAALLVVGALGAQMLRSMATLSARLWGSADDFPMRPEGAEGFATGLLGAVAWLLMPVLGALFGCAVIGGLLQGRPGMSWARLKPKWSKLNPFGGFKRLFGKQALVEFAKTFAKLLLVGGVAAWVAWPHAAGIDRLVGADPRAAGNAATGIIVAMLRPVAMIAAALALFDIVWQRHAFLQKMRMSLQEVKDEHKQTDGDPKVKAKVRSIQMQRARGRMMAAVPDASVVIANPTHFAVALQYDHGAMAAPVVVAKGVDAVALRIRAAAEEAGVPVVENKPLARALHASCELERPIPIEHYAAVAEVISYVLKVAKKRG